MSQNNFENKFRTIVLSFENAETMKDFIKKWKEKCESKGFFDNGDLIYIPIYHQLNSNMFNSKLAITLVESQIKTIKNDTENNSEFIKLLLEILPDNDKLFLTKK